ncbi:MAG: cation transporter [Deltaproteobacteria bacterium]|nr:cation transporter [Deltaproteobacteria bacterium]
MDVVEQNQESSHSFRDGDPSLERGGESESFSGQVEIGEARKRAALSVGLNLALSLGKGAAGILSGSSALLGDAIHSATDVIASAAAYGGLWLAGRRHPSFPYGLYKAETVATLVTSAAIILAGYEIGRRALLGPKTLPDVSTALPVALSSLVVTVAFGLYQLHQGRRLHSPALVADARDYLADGLSTALVVVSLIGASFGVNLDRWAAGAVALFVFWSGGQLLWRAVRDLMDEAVDRGTERAIIHLVQSHPRVESVERCLSRTAGGRYIVDLDVIMRTRSNDLADRVRRSLERDLIQHFPRLVMVRIRPKVRQSEQIRRLTPVKGPGGPLEVHMAKAPWFLLEKVDRKTGMVLHQDYLQNPYGEAERKRGFLVGKWILGFKPDEIVLDEEKEGTAFALIKEAGVDVILQKDPEEEKEE